MMQVRGGVISSWDRFDPLSIYGVRTGQAANGPAPASPGIERAAGPGVADQNVERPWHPDSPLFWFGALLLTTAGLIGASTAVRVGPFRAALSAGDPT